MAQITVTAGAATETTTGAEGGIDVDFTATIDGRELDGECTLLRDHTGRWGAWGGPDHWLDGATWAQVRDLADDVRRAVLDAIEAECSPVAAEFALGEPLP